MCVAGRGVFPCIAFWTHLCYVGVRRSSALFKVEQTEHMEYTDYMKVTNNTFRLNTHAQSEAHIHTSTPDRLYVFNTLRSSTLLWGHVSLETDQQGMMMMVISKVVTYRLTDSVWVPHQFQGSVRPRHVSVRLPQSNMSMFPPSTTQTTSLYSTFSYMFYFSTPLQFRNKYCTFYPPTFFDSCSY